MRWFLPCGYAPFEGKYAGTLTNLGYELYGDKAALRAYGTMFQLSGHPGEPIRQRLELDDGLKTSAVKPAAIRNIYQALIDGHAKSVLDGRPLDADDAIHNLAVCEAVHASARKGGRTVTVKL